MAVAGLWPLAHPSDPVRRAVEDPALTDAIVPFEASLEQMLGDLLHGLAQ